MVSLMTPFQPMLRDFVDILARLDTHPQSIRFEDLRKLCEHYFGRPRRKGSHLVFTTGLPDPPILNIQPRGSMAKEYQCKQALKAVRRKQGQ